MAAPWSVPIHTLRLLSTQMAYTLSLGMSGARKLRNVRLTVSTTLNPRSTCPIYSLWSGPSTAVHALDGSPFTISGTDRLIRLVTGS